MNDGFVCAYSDILFRDSVVKTRSNHPGDIVLCVDTHWRDRYVHRSQHPEGDAEKALVERRSRDRNPPRHALGKADGEYIGVGEVLPARRENFREHYHRIREKFAGKPWREAKIFEKAYLILLFQEMIEQGVPIHFVATHGDYMEIDTEEDYALANRDWK
jgi:choline kinase